MRHWNITTLPFEWGWLWNFLFVIIRISKTSPLPLSTKNTNHVVIYWPIKSLIYPLVWLSSCCPYLSYLFMNMGHAGNDVQNFQWYLTQRICHCLYYLWKNCNRQNFTNCLHVLSPSRPHCFPLDPEKRLKSHRCYRVKPPAGAGKSGSPTHFMSVKEPD